MSKSPLVTPNELRRLRARADENTTLANCWSNPHTALVTMEYSPVGCAYAWNGWVSCNETRGYWRLEDEMPVLTLSVAAPRLDGPRRYAFWMRSQMALWGSRRRSRVPAASDQKVFYEPAAVVKTELERLFRRLGEEYAAVCVCSHRAGQTRRALEGIGFEMPRAAVFVDLVRVLEYQARFGGVPGPLRRYVDARLHVDERNGWQVEEKFEVAEGDGRYLDFNETAPRRGRDGEWIEVIRRREDVSAKEVLAILGPQAEVYRRHFDHLERDNVAVERASRGLGKKEAKEVRRAAKMLQRS